MNSRILLCVGLVLLTLQACKKSTPKTPPPAPLNLRTLRIDGLLHAERDTPKGYEAAAKCFAEVVARNPDDFDDQLNLARVLIFLDQRHDAALAALDKAKALIPEGQLPPDWWFIRGVALDRKRDYTGSFECYRKTESLSKEHPQSIFRCGDALVNAGRTEDALPYFERLLAKERLLRPASYRLFRLYRGLERKPDEKRCLAIFQSTDKDEILDTEKCSFTRVRLRPAKRPENEPAPVALSWKPWEEAAQQMKDKAGLDGVRQVVPLRAAEDETAALVLLHEDSLTLLSFRGRKLHREERLPLEGLKVSAITAGDLDNDAKDELVLVHDQGLRILDGKDGLHSSWGAGATLPGILALRLFDVDHDGDLDAVVTKAGGAALALQNDGQRGFKALPALPIRLPLATAESGIDAHDFDQASDLDLLFAGGEKGPVALLNHRHDGYRAHPLEPLGKSRFVIAEDLDNDGGPDFFALDDAGRWRMLLNRDPFGRPYELNLVAPARSGSSGVSAPRALSSGDLDNDGDLDLLVCGPKGITLLRNERGGHFRAEALLSGSGYRSARCLDLDGDARLELLAVDDAGKLQIRWSTTQPSYAGMIVLPDGRRDNEGGVGAVVELHAGKNYRSAMVKESWGLHLGLGIPRLDEVDGLFARWPQGIRQGHDRGEEGLGIKFRLPLKQPEGLIASCPFLYTLGPDGWCFQSDVVAIAPLDEWMRPGQVAHRDPEEFVRIPGSALTIDENGQVRVAITEELRETAYVDRMELHWVDHAPGTRVHNDESTNQGAYDPLKIHSFREDELHAPRSVSVKGVEDALALVAEKDGRYLHGYAQAPTQWDGWVEPYTIDLVLDAPATTLLLQGRIAWYDSTTNFALAQNGRSWGPLCLEHVEEEGAFSVLVQDLGVPAGMDRTLVVPFSKTPMPAGTRLRLRGQHRFLWDRIRFANSHRSGVVDGRNPSLPDVHHGSARPERATLGWHGFSAIRGNHALHEQSYDHDAARPSGLFPRPAGRATRYGEVTELLRKHDDFLVVLAPGDRMEVSFKAPPPVEGRVRTWFLKISGWAKEASYHNETGRRIEPLPFRSMTSYPPKEGEGRKDAAYLEYLETWQTRVIRR